MASEIRREVIPNTLGTLRHAERLGLLDVPPLLRRGPDDGWMATSSDAPPPAWFRGIVLRTRTGKRERWAYGVRVLSQERPA